METLRQRPVQSNWHYGFDLPLADYRTEVAAINRPYAVDLVGVDGRWTGGLRRFPGFRTLLRYAAPEFLNPGQYTSGCSTGFNFGFRKEQIIDFFKYAEVQRYPLGLRLRGFVIRVGKAVMFHYYDEYLGTWEIAILDIHSSGEIDITYGDRYIWLVSSRNYGRSIWWEDGAFHSALFGEVVATPAFASLTVAESSTDGLLTKSDTDTAEHTVAYRLIDTRRGLCSPLYTQAIRKTELSDPYYISGTLDLSSLGEEELAGYNGFEIFRTINQGGVLYRAVRLVVTDLLSNPHATLWDWFNQEEPLTFVLGGSETFQLSSRLYDGSNDTSLVLLPAYDPTTEPTSDSPFYSRIYYTDGVNFAVAGAESTTRRLGDVRYSSLTEMAPEHFPASNYYAIPRTSDEPLALKRAGDFLFGLASTRVFRIAVVGASVTVERISHGWGLVNRYAAAEVGTDVAYLGDSTLVTINGSDGELQTVGSIERLLNDRREWQGHLDSVFLVFDSVSNALFLVNPETEDALVIWGNTNTVTRLQDMTFIRGTSGPHPEEGGRDRAFFLTEDGRIVYFDSERASESPSQIGLEGTNSGTFTSTSTGTTVTDTAAAFEAYVANCYLYILSGASRGERRRVTDSTETTLILESAVSVAAGDRYALSPVPFEVVGAMLWTNVYSNDEEIKDFASRRKLLTVGYSLRCDALPPLAQVQLRGYSDPTSREPDSEVWKDMTDVVGESFGFVNVAGPTLFPAVRCVEANCDFVLRSMVVEAEICGTMVSTG